jgi:hypothetical protein
MAFAALVSSPTTQTVATVGAPFATLAASSAFPSAVEEGAAA